MNFHLVLLQLVQGSTSNKARLLLLWQVGWGIVCFRALVVFNNPFEVLNNPLVVLNNRLEVFNNPLEVFS